MHTDQIASRAVALYWTFALTCGPVAARRKAVEAFSSSPEVAAVAAAAIDAAVAEAA